MVNYTVDSKDSKEYMTREVADGSLIYTVYTYYTVYTVFAVYIVCTVFTSMLCYIAITTFLPGSRLRRSVRSSLHMRPIVLAKM